jgi:Taurine catabolism dioxygenase TauD, TfdA family
LPVGVRTLDRAEPGSVLAGCQRIGIEALGMTLGAVVSGVDLSVPLDDELFAEIDTAFKEWKVIFFRDQDITLEQQCVRLTVERPYSLTWRLLTWMNIVGTLSA